MQDATRVPDDRLETLIDPELRREIGDPVPVPFAAMVVYFPLLVAALAGSIWLTKTITPSPRSLR